jgi:hypothetical protein
MPDPNRSMFEREVDFSLEETINSYEACRALSQRARDINSQFRGVPEEGVELESPNPTVGALSDYSVGRIVLKKDEQVADDTTESATS